MNNPAKDNTKCSLPKKYILKKNKQFQYLFEHGKHFSSNYFVAFIAKNDSLQIGFSVQKGYKNKIQRNKLKRMTRELWRNYRIKPNLCNIVFLTKVDALNANYQHLSFDFNQLLSEIKKDFDNVKIQ